MNGTSPGEIITAGTALVSAATALVAVRQASRQRHAAVLPKIVAQSTFLPGGFAEIRAVNVGPGPALDVDLQFSIHPTGETWIFKTPVLPSGSGRDFAPSSLDERIDRLPLDIAVTVSGHCHNAFGALVQVDHRLDFAAEIRALGGGGPLRDLAPDPPLVEAVGALTTALERLAERLAPGPG